jgi:glyoxylase-like metal-dependent hydrolase (beta-lactamase superfamily II)
MRSFFYALALGACTASAVAQVADEPYGAQGSPAADIGYFQIVRPVTKGVWLLTQPKFQLQPDGNVTVIEQRDGLVLVDAGGSPGSGRRIVAMVKSLSPKPVKAVVISQWHGDKPQGLTEILKAWPNARTISTATTQAHLADPKTMNTPAAPDAKRNADFQKQVRDEIDHIPKAQTKAATDSERQGYNTAIRMLRQWALDMDGALTIPTKEGFTDHLMLADPERPAEAMFLGRANTDGDAVVWLPKQKILVAGEIVILPFPYGFGSYPSDWLATLGKLRAIPFRTLIPGHGMPQTNRAQIDRLEHTLKDVRAQVAPLAAQGLTLEQVHARVDLGAGAKLFVGSDPWLNRWFKAFFTDPIVTSAYKEAKGEPIVQNLRG